MKFIPYGKQTIESDDIEAVVETLKSDFLTTGPKVKEFEEAICKYTDAKYCVAVSNGTTALHLASVVLLQPNDKVITTPNSFLATSNSILYVNAKPVFIDIAEDGNIDLDQAIELLKIDNTIKALYGVHFSGNPLNQETLKYIRDNFNIKILEDSAHSLGATFNNIKAGSCEFSDISILSFHPVKNITTGEGGAITTNSKEIYEKLLMLRTHGMLKTTDMKPWEYQMIDLGFNYRITDIQCALGISQIKKLDSFLEKRRNIALKYNLAFKNTVIKPLYEFNPESAYHLYVVLVDFNKLSISKEELFTQMRKRNVGLQLHYIPINQQPYYKTLGFGNEITPNMDIFYKQAFSLPVYPLLTEDEQIYVINNLLELLK